MVVRTRLAALLALAALCACTSAKDAAQALDDPRLQGHLSLRERSLCDPPESHPDWCDWPHEIRAFVAQRDECDHWRGEPWPEVQADADATQQQSQAERRTEIGDGLDRTCKGTDKRLRALKHAYAMDKSISEVLDGYETDIEADDANDP